MAGRRGAAAVLLALAPAALALRAATPAARTPGSLRPHSQQLTNFFDVQYAAPLTLGGQALTGMMDTGSSELTAFSQRCATCGLAASYSEQRSPSFTRGRAKRRMSYTSGTCDVQSGSDMLAVGDGSSPAARQSFWLATACEMPVLSSASFNAIVGLGPPEQPEVEARALLQQAESKIAAGEANGEQVPDTLLDMRDRYEEELRLVLARPPLLRNLRVWAFSVCIGRSPGSPGWLTWFDADRILQSGSHRVPVVGSVSWSIAVRDVALRQPGLARRQGHIDSVLGCGKGCNAIVDTGSSLIGVPSELHAALSQAVSGWDCSDLRGMPDLTFWVGSLRLRLPASSYVGHIVGPAGPEATSLLRLRGGGSAPAGAGGRSGQACDLLLMDLGSGSTSEGPQLILGMPFFREYHTTFDLGRSAGGNRSVILARADRDCLPTAGTSLWERGGARGPEPPRSVDASRLLLPSRLRLNASAASAGLPRRP